MRARKLWGGLAYCLFVVAFVEIALQFFYYVTAGDFLFRRSAPPLYQSEPFAGYMNRPGLSFDHHTNEFHAHYDINQAGFRVSRPGLEYSVAKPAGTYRIMLLGPSFAYGWGVEYEKSFAALLPQILMNQDFAKNRRIELINTGVPAMPPASQLNWYEHVGKRYQPDLVIQFIYGSMAVKSNPHSTIAADSNGYLVDTSMSASQRWRERLKQFATVFYGWMLWTDFDAWLHPESNTSSNSVLGAGRELIQIDEFNLDRPEVRDAILFYRRFTKAVRDSGARPLIVYFPLSYAIYPQDEARWRHLGVKNVVAQKAFDTAFVNYLNEQQIPTVNITEDLRKSAALEKKRLYNWLDIHWTPEGNAVAARAVADALTRRQ